MTRLLKVCISVAAVLLLPCVLLHAQTNTPSAPAPPLSTEDWTTISLAKSGLPLDSIGGLSLSKVDLPGCTQELVRVQWRPGDPIDVYITRPTGVDRPPVVLFLYNYTFDTDIFRADGWCQRVKQYGFAAVGFSSALSWQRFHSPRPMKEWFVSELQEALATSTHDVQMMLNYLDGRKDLDMKHIAMFGQGSGGAIAILAAAADSRISALDLMDPWGDWPDWLRESRQIPETERPNYLKAEFLQKVSTLDPVSYLPQLKLKGLRMEQVGTDPVTPDIAKQKIAAAAPKSEDVFRYPDELARRKSWGADGGFTWLSDQLQPGTRATANTLNY